MIVFLDGKLEEKHPTRAVISVSGVGYEVLIPLSSYDRLPAPGEPCRILTHDHVREDDHLLFGFMTEAERAMFVMLMSVSGVGPKIALSALSGMTVRELRGAIASADAKRLSTISGIGRKTAERLIVELKDRLSPADALEAAAAPEPGAEDLRSRDAILALISLGYKRAEAQQMVARVSGQPGTAGLGVEELVRRALSA
jgi:Holliday junction DNA helicase RuvA